MSNRSETFGRLLKGAINSIAAYEGKTAPAIEDELGDQIGVAGSTIQRYKAGYLPTEPRVVQVLAEAAVRRGYLSRAWLQRFLQAARYPTPDGLIAQFGDLLGSTGDQRSSDLPGGTLIFLFTDVEGSTTLWEQHAEAMERALARHDAIMRQAIDAYGGQVFNTAGDAFHAAFTIAADALDAVLAAQRALATEAWGPIAPIRVRAALHAGAAQPRDGDYFGQPLNRIARLCAAGHGGQVLLSNAAQELVRDALPKGVALRDLGEHRLKDLARPERIFQITAPDLPADFPALRTLDSYTHNLPTQPTALIGREAEVGAVCDQLRRNEVRLLTLTGPGGIGKTRLALQAAAELLDDFRDGVFFVPLAPIRDPQLVAGAIAQALGFKEQGERSLVEQLKAYLRAKRALLLLDNFEQVSAAGPLIGELLAAAPGLKALVTSRERLHVYGEREYGVPPLGLPDMRRLPPIERLTQYEAVRLFIERAQAVRPDFAVTTDNAPAVAEICVRLDGLPLAIELAATRGKLFPPRALLARLDKRLSMLTGGPRDLPARQQTLRNTIAWSYDLLDPAEQAIFARLGVFVGGCTLESAEAVLADDRASDAGDLTAYIPASAVLDGLASLMDKSLLKQIEGVADEARFMMLETIHEFALEQLEASGESEVLRRRHALYYLGATIRLGQAQEVYQKNAEGYSLRAEVDNLRAALGWALKQREAEIAQRLSGALFYFGSDHIPWSERRALVDAALAMCEGEDASPADDAARAIALDAAGWAAGHMGDYDRAQAHFTARLAVCRDLGDSAGTALAQRSLGWVALLRGDLVVSQTWVEQSMALCREAHDLVGIAWSLYDLGHLAFVRGAPAQAEPLLAESLALFRDQSNEYGCQRALISLGHTARVQGQVAHATTWYRESFMAGSPTRLTPEGMSALESLAANVRAQGQPEKGARLFGAAEALRESAGFLLPQIDRADYERDVATLRAQLHEASFATAWAAGRALSLEQAIAEALAISG